MADIDISVMGIKTPLDTGGRVDLDTAEPGRRAEIERGVSNLNAGQIMVFDASGSPSKISVKENNRIEGAMWNVKAVTGPNENEFVGKFILVFKRSEWVWENVGKGVPFEAIRAERDADSHGNVFHLRYTGEKSGEYFVQQVRTLSDGQKFESPWLGAHDGRGFRIGRQ